MEVDLPQNPNPSSPLPTSETLQSQAADLLLNKLGKIKVADHARLMVDNQRTLNTTLAADRAHRSLGQRIREWDFDRFRASQGGGPVAPQQPGVGIDFGKDDEMGINIDSPTTINYHVPPVPAAAATASGTTSTLGKVVQGASLMFGGVGLSAIVGLALGLLNRPSEPAPQAEPVPYVAPTINPTPQPKLQYQPGGVRLEVVPYQPR